MREETPPGVAEFHAAGAPDEQLLAESPLQPRNPLGQGLGQVQVHARHLCRQPRVVKTAMNSCWTGESGCDQLEAGDIAHQNAPAP